MSTPMAPNGATIFRSVANLAVRCLSASDALSTDATAIATTTSAANKTPSPPDDNNDANLKELMSALRSTSAASKAAEHHLKSIGWSQSINDTMELDWFDCFKNMESSSSGGSTALKDRNNIRTKKQDWIYKNAQAARANSLVVSMVKKMGPDATLKILRKLGWKTHQRDRRNPFISSLVGGDVGHYYTVFRCVHNRW